jgi:hypothetical protein
MDTDTYSVTITMSAATVRALVNSNYVLYGLRAVESSDAAAMPLVWLRTQAYSLSTKLSYTGTLEAYTSMSALAPGAQIDVGFATPIACGQLLTVDGPGGSGAVTADGMAAVLSILNATNREFTCGIGEDSAPVCAMPLYGDGLQLIVPVPRIFLMFTTTPISPATAIELSTGPGLLIDQATAEACAVSFDINGGWSAGGQPYAQPLPPRTRLAPLLAAYSRTLSSKRVVAGAVASGVEGT